MITITIDGKEIHTDPSKTIIDAAFENGIYIPHFCWHPSLSVSGNCRICLVEVEKMPKQVIACSTLCMDGMVVHVNSEKAIRARNAVMEFVLINHPLDCPICDEAGECKLQDYTYKYSVGESRFDEEKMQKGKRIELGPCVMFDAERCISCSRCLRFCEDIVGYPQLTFVNRGDRVTIKTFPEKALDNPYSMNVIDICPVGALTSRDFRFKARVWDMSSTPGICPGCARGCNVNVWVKQNTILRLTPRENQEVNDFWMCDQGRLESWRHVNAESRIQHPMVKREGVRKEVDWDEALASVASELRMFSNTQIAVIASPFDTCEDNYLVMKLATEVFQIPFLNILPHVQKGDQDDFLIRDDKTPNSAGAQIVGASRGDESYSIDVLIEKMKRGEIKAIIITDNQASNHPEFFEALSGVPYILAVVSNSSVITERADAVLPASTFAEKTGTFVNFMNHIQVNHHSVITSENERWIGGFQMSRLDKCGTDFDRWGKVKRIDSRSTWKIIMYIGRLLGANWKYDHPEDVFEEMTGRIPVLKGLTYENIGRWGVRLAGEKPQRKLPYIYSDVHQ